MFFVSTDDQGRALKAQAAGKGRRTTFTMVQTWVQGPELPEWVVEDGLLTVEDHRALTLDHIERTCEVVVKLEIHKSA